MRSARQKGLVDHVCPADFSQLKGKRKIPLTIITLALPPSEGAFAPAAVVSRQGHKLEHPRPLPRGIGGGAMAENEGEGGGAATEAAEAAPPKRGKLKLIIAATGFLVIIGGGVGGWMFMSKGHDEKHAEAPAAKPPVYVDVPEIMVNLAGLPGERVQYLKVKVVLEVKEEKQVEAIKPAMPRVSDIFQTYLRELRSSDLNGSAGLFRLKEELTRRVNAAVAPQQVTAVLFKEIVIQ
jgi:flagellar FliL protein